MGDIDYFDIVEIISINDESTKEIKGKKGVVIGSSEDKNNNINWYAIDIEGITWMLKERDFFKTGEKISSQSFYAGEQIKVTVNAKTGRGMPKKS